MGGLDDQWSNVLVDGCREQENSGHVAEIVADPDVSRDELECVEQPRKSHVDLCREQVASGRVRQSMVDAHVATEGLGRVEPSMEASVDSLREQQAESLEAQEEAGGPHRKRPGCGEHSRIAAAENAPNRHVPCADLRGRVRELKMAFEDQKQVSPAAARAKSEGSGRVRQLRKVLINNLLEHQPESLEADSKAGDAHLMHLSGRERSGCGEQLGIAAVNNAPNRQPRFPSRLVPCADLQGRVRELKEAFEEQKEVGSAAVRAKSEGSGRVRQLRNVLMENMIEQQPESLEAQSKASDAHLLHLSDHERPGCGEQLKIDKVNNAFKRQFRFPTRPVPCADLRGRVRELKEAFEEQKEVAPAAVRAKSEGSGRVRQLRNLLVETFREKQPESLAAQSKRGDPHLLQLSDHEHSSCREQLRSVAVQDAPEQQHRVPTLAVPSADLQGRVRQLRTVFLSEEHDKVPTPRKAPRESVDCPGRVEQLMKVHTRKGPQCSR